MHNIYSSNSRNSLSMFECHAISSLDCDKRGQENIVLFDRAFLFVMGPLTNRKALPKRTMTDATGST